VRVEAGGGGGAVVEDVEDVERVLGEGLDQVEPNRNAQ
jgi:hypothetical protein